LQSWRVRCEAQQGAAVAQRRLRCGVGASSCWWWMEVPRAAEGSCEYTVTPLQHSSARAPAGSIFGDWLFWPCPPHQLGPLNVKTHISLL
jgi:hypothetical protein